MENYLKELVHNGKLYHYTTANGYNKILNPEQECDVTKSKFPKDCISLQFKRIDLMTRNDEKERRHMKDLVLALLEKSQNTGLTKDFVKMVLQYTPTDEAFYTTIKYEEDSPESEEYVIFDKKIVKWGVDSCDYYAACFSTNPYNKHIIKNFGSEYIFSFKECFSSQPNLLTQHNLSWFYPFSSLRNAFLDFDIRKVVYTKEQLSEVLLKEFLFLQHQYFSVKNLKERLQDLYAKYDAFVKSEEYAPEEEVRFIVSIPQQYDTKKLEKHGIFFRPYENKDQKGDTIYVPNGCMFLPIDKTLFIDKIYSLEHEIFNASKEG